MPLEVKPLGYDYAALEPHIDAKTMEIHHSKHYATYVNNYNDAIKKQPELDGKPLHEVLAKNLAMVKEEIKTAVRNNGGGAHNHALFWEIMNPAGKSGSRMIKPGLWPRTDFVDVGIRSDLSENAGARTEEQDTFTGALEQRAFIDVIADTLRRRMTTDPTVVVLGEDVHRLKGGTNGATKGLAQAFPDRVLGTPISENAFVGLGGGMAMDDSHLPVGQRGYGDRQYGDQ